MIDSPSEVIKLRRGNFFEDNIMKGLAFIYCMQYIGYMKQHTFIRSIKRQSLSEQIYESLRAAIIRLELAPGQKIKDVDLAEQFNVSRTPIREAIKRLETEGLVVSEPGAVTRIKAIDLEEVKQAFVVVASLHRLAARLAVPILSKEQIAQLKIYNEELKRSIENDDMISAITADDRFHQVFIKASKNKEIEKVLDYLIPKLRRLEYQKFDSKRGLSSFVDHKAIIKASEKKDVPKVETLVEQNWLSLSDYLIQLK